MNSKDSTWRRRLQRAGIVLVIRGRFKGLVSAICSVTSITSGRPSFLALASARNNSVVLWLRMTSPSFTPARSNRPPETTISKDQAEPSKNVKAGAATSRDQGHRWVIPQELGGELSAETIHLAERLARNAGDDSFRHQLSSGKIGDPAHY